MKAYLRVTDYTNGSNRDTLKTLLDSGLSYGWKIVSVKPAVDQLYDYMVIAEKTGRTDINTRPF